MRMMKKGQQEIMGLAIVIVLMVISILAIAKLNSFGTASYKKDYEQAELASSMLNALLATTGRDCDGISMMQILQDCAGNPDSQELCNAENSCAYFEQQAKEIFKNTLESWHVNYEFSTFYDEESPIIELGKPCINKKSELFPVHAELGTLFIKLDICR